MSQENNIKCRTCLKSNTKLQSIGTKPKISKIDKTYTELISHIAQIKDCGILPKFLCKFDTDDEHKMPQGICYVCSKKIRDSYSFIKQVRKCNTILLEGSIHMTDDPPVKIEENFATENVILDDSEEQPSIKQELNPIDDEEMNEPKEEVDSDSSSSDSHDNFNSNTVELNDADTLESPKELPPATTDVAIKTETCEQPKSDQTELFSESLLNEDLFSDDDSLSEFISTEGDDDDYDPLENSKQKKRSTKNSLDDEKNLSVPYEHCDRLLQNASQLKRHKRDTHLQDELKVHCPNCPATFTKRYNMYAHMRILHKIEPVLEQIRKPVTCEYCQKPFSNKYTLMTHVKKKHESDSHLPKSKTPRKCEECGKVCKNYQSLYAHKRYVHISEDMYTVCLHCGKKYKTSQDLKDHISQFHTNTDSSSTVVIPEAQEKLFICTECPYETTNTTHLKTHITRHHIGEKPFICEICGNAFLTSYKLKTHRYLHTGEKPHKCPFCPKSFRLTYNLTKHKRIHSGERPFECAECGKGFRQEYTLSVHKRTHARKRNKGKSIGTRPIVKKIRKLSKENQHCPNNTK